MKVVFTKASGFVAWCIRLFTGSKISHVGLELDDGSFLHADKGGVQVSSKREFLLRGERSIVAEFEPVGTTAYYIDTRWGMKKIGAGYDYLGLIGDLIPTLSWRWFHVKLGDPLNMESRYWCSEFIVALDTKQCIHEFQELNSRTVTPGQLFEALDAGFSFRRVL